MFAIKRGDLARACRAFLSSARGIVNLWLYRLRSVKPSLFSSFFVCPKDYCLLELAKWALLLIAD